MLREIAFVDPGISNPGELLRGLRPGVEGIELSRYRDALEQIAQALEGRAGLDAIHIVAHGAPGEISFASGALSRETIELQSNELAAIGAALAPGGRLSLWSCETASGWRGACFVEALERAIGAEVAAATGLIGAAAKGGSWVLETNSFIAAQAPLTAEAIQTYEGVMTDFNMTNAVNNFTGGVGSDNFIYDNTSDVNSGDSINGAGGTDTIQLNASGTFDLTTTTISNIEQITATGINQAQTLTLTTGQLAQFTSGINLGSGSDTLIISANGTVASITIPTLTSVETLNLIGSGGTDSVTLTAAQFSQFNSIDLGNGTDTLTVNVSGSVNISAGNAPTISNTETVALTGTGAADTITLTGAQLNAFTSINLGNGSDTINLTSTSTGLNGLGDAALSGVETISASGAGSAVTIDLTGQTEAFTITGGGSGDTLIGGSGNDTITGGDGGDTMTGGAGADVFNFAASDNALSIGGSGTGGTISGYDVVTDFTAGTTAAGSEKIGFGSAAIVGNGATNGNNSTLDLHTGNVVSSHSITNGIISFDDNGAFGAAVPLTSVGDVAAVVQYLQANDIGTTGSTVAFVATISGVTHTYVYIQGSTGTSTSTNVLVDLVNVQASSISATGGQISVIDATAPTAPTITSITENAGGGINAAEAADGTPVVVSISGTGAIAGDTLTINWGGQTATHTLTAAEIIAGSSTVTVPAGTITTQGNGTFNVTAKLTDGVGNASGNSSATSVTVDTVAPGNPAISTIGAGGANGGADNTISAQAGDNTIVGTAEANSTITIKSGITTLGTATTDGLGNWSYTLTSGNITTLGQGAGKVITATATDAVGNASGATTSSSFAVDTIAPTAVATVTAISADSGTPGDFITNTAAQTVSGTFTGTVAAGETIQVSADGVNWVNATSNNGLHTWSASGVTLSSGTSTLLVRTIDTAGNATGGTGHAYTLDQTPPAAATINVVAVDDVINIAERDGTVTVTGTNEAGSTVTLNGNAVVTDSPTTWHYVLSASDINAFGQGGETLTVVSTDVAGNSTISTHDITIDTVAPAAGTLSFDNLIDTGSTDATPITSDNNFDLTLAGQEGGATVAYEVSVNGGAFVSTGAVQTGLADGDYQFRAVVTDAAGNSSTSNVIGVVIDNTPPDAPVVTSIEDDTGSSDGVTSDTSLTIHGTAEANSVVEVFRDGDSIGTATADGSGNWSLADPATLADGTSYVYTATATDAAGNTSDASEDFAVTIDTTNPDAPGVALSNDSGTDGDLLTNDGTLSLSGVESGALVEYSTDGGETWVPTFAAIEGPNDVLVRQTDVAGNVSDATPFSFTLDTVIETPTVALENDSGSEGDDLITNDASLTVSDPAGDVTRVFVVDGGDQSETYTAPTDQGEHTVQVIDTDAAGNTANTSISFTLDTINPDAPGVSLSNDTGSSGADLLTNDGTLSLSGVEGGALVEYSTDGGDTWSETFSAVEGTNDVQVRQTDVAGNQSDPTSFSFVLDTTNPDAPGVALSNDSGTDGDLLTNDGTLSLSGVEDDAVVEYSTDGGGSWSATAPTYANDGSDDGDHTVDVRQTDVAGNVSAPASITFSLDTIAPDAVAEVTAISDDSGADPADFVTNIAAQIVSGTFTGTLGVGETIQVSADGSTWIDAVTSGSDWTASGVTLASGTNTLSVRTIDTAGNITSGTGHGYTLDTAIDTPSIALSNDSGSDNGDLLTNDASLTVSDPAGDVTRVFVVDGGPESDSYTAPTDQGEHTVQVFDTDTAGNTANTSITFVLDTIAPDAPEITAFSDDSGVQGDNRTNDNTPTLTIAAAAGSIVEIFRDNVSVGFATEGDPGSFSFTSADLGDATYSFTAKAIDEAGNASSASDPLVLAIDTGGGAPSEFVGNVAENSAAGTVVGILALDAEDAFTFAFPTDTPFEIHFNSDTGQYEVRTTAPLDFEQQAQWAFVLHVTDTTTDNDADVAMTIDVGNVAGVTINGSKKNDTINDIKTVKGQHVFASGEEDVINGKGGNDKISGLDGNDTLKGGAGNDKLIGGLGFDTLFGNAGADKFVFNNIDESTLAAPDDIKDFNRKQHDKIVLKDIDANSLTDGNQAFHFIGNDHDFTGNAGDLRYDKALHLLQGDTDGDGTADFAIHLNVGSLAKGDFVL